MKVFIPFILLLSALRTLAATGDILSVTVRPDGWTADVTIEGLSTGGTYNFGWDATATPATSTPKITFTVVSLGFDDTGAATTITRTVYGTKQLRKPYPNEAQNEETASGGNVTVRIALSDYIYQKDATGAGNSGTAPVVSILSGFYTQAATPNNASGAGYAVTNNSTAAYPAVIGAWNVVPFQKVGSTFKLRAGAYHRHAQSGRPVRAVKFSVSDGTTTVTETATTATISNDDGDAVPIPEYIVTIDASTLTQGATLTCQMQQYPWVGDAASVLDTSTSGYTAPDPRHAPLPMLLDRTGAYGMTYAKVDATTGNDTTGVAYDSGAWDYATAAPFATMAKAARAIRDYNSANRSRDNVGAGIVQMAAGAYNGFGSTQSGGYGATPATWITFEPGPGVAREFVVISGEAGDNDISDRVRLHNLKITTTVSGTFSGIGAVWWDGCEITTTNNALMRTGNHWVTQCKITQLSQGLRGFSTEAASHVMIRGNTFEGFSGVVRGYNSIGNLRPSGVSGNVSYITCITGSLAPAAQSQIVAYNITYQFLQNPGQSTSMHDAFTKASIYEPQRGYALVQNVFERIGTSETAVLSDMGVGDQDTNNVLVWNNTFLGQRQNWAYNSEGTAAVNHRFWSLKNNLLHDYNIKTDTFGTPSANRVGNWPVLYGIGYSGNVLAGDDDNNFVNEFPGLKYNVDNYEIASAATFFNFTNYAANADPVTGLGGGTYTLTPTSPAYELALDQVLPFDIAGTARGATDSAGAYTTSTTPTPPDPDPEVPAAGTITTGTINAGTIYIGPQ